MPATHLLTALTSVSSALKNLWSFASTWSTEQPCASFLHSGYTLTCTVCNVFPLARRAGDRAEDVNGGHVAMRVDCQYPPDRAYLHFLIIFFSSLYLQGQRAAQSTFAFRSSCRLVQVAYVDVPSAAGTMSPLRQLT